MLKGTQKPVWGIKDSTGNAIGLWRESDSISVSKHDYEEPTRARKSLLGIDANKSGKEQSTSAIVHADAAQYPTFLKEGKGALIGSPDLDP